MLHFTTALLALVSAATAATAATARTEPAHPVSTFLYSVNLTMGTTLELGPSYAGNRSVQPIAGGQFSGPRLHGNVTAGLDWGVLDPAHRFSPEALYVLNTHDGAHILVRERGHSPNIVMVFETGRGNYSWLNQAVGYATGGPNAAGVVQLDVWTVSAARLDDAECANRQLTPGV